MEARDGTYVRYPAEELYAIIALESHRNKARIVGEDLGTVPPGVRPAMARHNIKRTFVVQVSLSPDRVKPLGTIPANSLGCINTHDMPPFASFWRGQDISDRVSLGLLDEKESIAEKARRREVKNAFAAFLRRLGWLRESGTETEPILLACLSCLSASSADAVIVNLEDLWGETKPQNIPGTWEERPNWMRKAMYSFEAFSEMPRLTDTLQMMNRLRKHGKAGGRKSRR
jgi:4-alpha-glucanotransferase